MEGRSCLLELTHALSINQRTSPHTMTDPTKPAGQPTTMMLLRRRLAFLAVAALALLAGVAAKDASIPDTKENRVKQAKRVLAGTPIEETLEGIIQEAIRVKGQDAADDIRAAIARSDTSELSGAMERAYATTFTADELAFLADYANSEVGKRVQRKMPNYVSKVHPAMQAYAKVIFEDVKAKDEAAQKAAGGKGKGKEKGASKGKKGATTPAESIKVASGAEL